MIYQIKDWPLHFENDRSKTRDKCSFVCIPNKQSGMGFSRLMAEPDGLSIYGTWHLITGACSQQRRPREGWLTDTGRGPDGECEVSAWGAIDLALKFRRKPEEMQRALDVLSSKSIGWMIAHNNSPPTHRVVTADSPPTHLEGKGKKEWKGGKEAPPQSDFSGEIPDLKQAIEMIMTCGIPNDFAKMVHGTWFSRGGKDGAGVAVDWLRYVLKRWTKEGTEWRSGTHREQQRIATPGGIPGKRETWEDSK